MPAPSVDLLPARVTTESRTSQRRVAPDRLPAELAVMRNGPTHGLGLACLGSECLQRLVSAPELLLAGARAWLKDQPGHRVALVDSESETVAGLWCCKETVTRSWWVRFVTSWGSFRAHNAFRQGQALLQLQVSTPQPLAVMACTRNGAYHEYLLTEAVPAATSLQCWLLSAATSSPTAGDFQPRREVCRQLGLQLQRLHRHGFDHRDLKATNVLISEQAGKRSLWLIDLDGVWRWPLLPRPRRVQNLARLWAGVAGLPLVTRTDALRFLLAYLTPQQRTTWKSLWRQVARRSAAKIAKQRWLQTSLQNDGPALTTPGSAHTS